MEKFYKGDIISTHSFDDYTYYIKLAKINPDHKEVYHILGTSSPKAYAYFNKYTSDNLKKLQTLINNIITFDATDEEKQDLDKFMKSLFHPTTENRHGFPIYYSKLYDEDGNEYGKEIITGSIFPIRTKYSDFDVSYSSEVINKVYYDIDNKQGYTLDGSHFIDSKKGWHQLTSHNLSEAINLLSPHTSYIYFDNVIHNMTVCEQPVAFKIRLTPKMIFSPNQRVDYVIGGDDIANEREVNSYIEAYCGGLFKKRNMKSYERRMKEYELSNYLGDITFTDNNVMAKELVDESNMTKEMQELEFILYKLKSVSPEDYERLNKEYREILEPDDSQLKINMLSINSIVSLQNRAKLAYACHGGDSKNIISHLETQIDSYLNSYNNSLVEKTEVTISDLDKLSEYFLNSKNSYSIKEQNEILRCISLLYFFEMYENKDTLEIKDLENSYIINNIKRILVVIDVLRDEGIIKNVPNSLFDISNIEELLEFIKKIEISDSIETKGESLIKRIQQ